MHHIAHILYTRPYATQLWYSAAEASTFRLAAQIFKQLGSQFHGGPYRSPVWKCFHRRMFENLDLL